MTDLVKVFVFSFSFNSLCNARCITSTKVFIHTWIICLWNYCPLLSRKYGFTIIFPFVYLIPVGFFKYLSNKFTLTNRLNSCATWLKKKYLLFPFWFEQDILHIFLGLLFLKFWEGMLQNQLACWSFFVVWGKKVGIFCGRRYWKSSTENNSNLGGIGFFHKLIACW